jgi:hypothetical protein
MTPCRSDTYLPLPAADEQGGIFRRSRGRIGLSGCQQGGNRASIHRFQTCLLQIPLLLILTIKVLVATGRSYRLIGREVGLSKNTVADIVKRHRAKETPRTH